MRGLSRVERYALELLRSGLKTPELAHAMSWTFAEAQAFQNRMRSTEAARSKSSSPDAPGTSVATSTQR